MVCESTEWAAACEMARARVCWNPHCAGETDVTVRFSASGHPSWLVFAGNDPDMMPRRSTGKATVQCVNAEMSARFSWSGGRRLLVLEHYWVSTNGARNLQFQVAPGVPAGTGSGKGQMTTSDLEPPRSRGLRQSFQFGAERTGRLCDLRTAGICQVPFQQGKSDAWSYRQQQQTRLVTGSFPTGRKQLDLSDKVAR